MTKTGRNDPCPCGSGKKYKKCCLEKDMIRVHQAGRLSRSFTPAERDSAVDKLLSFGLGSDFELDRKIGFRLFWGGRLADRSDEEIQMVEELPQTEINFTTWYLFDMDVEGGNTVADFFLVQEIDRLSPGELAYLEKAMQTHFRLYEVEGVELHQGFRLKDLWTGEFYRVKERAGTHHFVQWDLMATRLIDAGHDAWVIDGGIYNYPPRTKEPILKSLRREHKRFQRNLPGQDDIAFFKRIGMLFHHWWLDWVAFRPLPQFITREGDELCLTRSVFEVRDARRLKQALEQCPEFHQAGPGRYSWREEVPEEIVPSYGKGVGEPDRYSLKEAVQEEPVPSLDIVADPTHRYYSKEAREGSRWLGTLTIKRDRLVLEALSKERAERGRSLLERIAVQAVRYRVTTYEDVEEALKSKPKGKKPRPPEIPPELEAQLIKQFLDGHYRKWLDEEIPALNHKTPRHAITLKTYRPRVINLLKELENMEARGVEHGKLPYDFGWLWNELGLDRERDA